MTETYDTTNGFAAFAAAAPDTTDQHPIHGVLIETGDVSNGMSGRPTRWPADVLRDAADRGVFEGKPLTQVAQDDPEQHWGVERTDGGLEIESNIPMEVKVGEITATTFEPGTGLVFEGFVADETAADTIERGLAQVSPVMATRGEELASADDGAEYEAHQIVAARDVAIVSDGAFPGNSVEPGALAAMTADALSSLFDTDTPADDSDGADADVDAFQGRVLPPAFEGYSTESWDAPSLRGTYGGDMRTAREAATFVRGDAETFTDMSLFVVDGEGRLNLNALDAAWRMASQTGGVSADEVDELRAMYERLAGEAMEAGAVSEAGEATWERRLAEAAGSALPTDADGVRGALARELADTSPGKTRTIKDGARSVDPRGSLARRVLGNQRGDAVDPDSDPVARQALGVDDDDEPDPDPVDVDTDPVARQVLGLDGEGDDD